MSVSRHSSRSVLIFSLRFSGLAGLSYVVDEDPWTQTKEAILGAPLEGGTPGYLSPEAEELLSKLKGTKSAEAYVPKIVFPDAKKNSARNWALGGTNIIN